MKYAAIDFETAYWGPGSACSLGISVSDGNERMVSSDQTVPHEFRSHLYAGEWNLS